MRRFDILLEGVVVGEGIERCGTVWCWSIRDEHKMAPGRLEFWANREEITVRYRDPADYNPDDIPPAAHASDGTPVYTATSPPPDGRVHPKYAGSPINRYFVGAVDDIIRAKRPKLWVFGHTHESIDTLFATTVTAEVTRLVANPYGYHDHDVNPAFNPALVIEVPS